MVFRDLLQQWPLYRQLTGEDRLGLGEAARSEVSAGLRPRTEDVDRVVDSVCPFCAVGCGQKVYVKDEEIVHIEGNPDSPISRGRLCPRGSSSKELVAGPQRETRIKYRAPGATEWTHLDLDTAIEMIAERVIQSRESTWEDVNEHGQALNRTRGFASLGGAALDNEENYLMKKLFTALGAIQVENQARI